MALSRTLHVERLVGSLLVVAVDEVAIPDTWVTFYSEDIDTCG